MFNRTLLIAGLLPALLFAKPIDPEVIHGQASFHSSGQQMEVVTGNKTIINWKSFSIDHPEFVAFNQFDANSSVLNRVLSGDVSKILGTLQSNGNVILINPNGIIFGENSIVNTNSFIGSTLDIVDGEFINGGTLRFSGNSTSAVVNLGTLKASSGDVALLGRFITNEGTISAPNGQATLAVGKEILLKPSGNNRFFVAPSDFEDSPLGTGITNTGTIDALRAHLIADGNPYDLAIKQDGKINAIDLMEHNGEVYLVAEGGAVEVRGDVFSPGGRVQILGKSIGLLENSLIDVSSPKKGGEVFIGGSFQGKDPEVYNSIYTFVEENVKIKANAKSYGDGGRVIVWSNGQTAFYGHIETKGGLRGGNGGFVEISGKSFLDMKGIADRTAPMGNPGKLLLDPSDISITNVATAGMLFTPGAIGVYSATAASSNLLFSDLINQLNLGDVGVTTNSAFGGNGDMSITTDINTTTVPAYNTANTLYLTTDRDLIIKNDVQNGGSGDIICNVGRDFIADGGSSLSRLGTRLGDVTITAAQDAIVLGGTGGLAQVGFDGDPFVISNVTMNIGRNLEVGAATGNTSIIGHTYVGVPTIIVGNLVITTGADAIVTGGNGANTGPALIGFDTENANCSWNLSIGQDLFLNANTNYALIGSTYSTVAVGNFNQCSGNAIVSAARDIIFNNPLSIPPPNGSSQAQIGSDGAVVNGDILVDVGRNLEMNSTRSFTLVGHTYTKFNPQIPVVPWLQPGLNFGATITVDQTSAYAGIGGSVTLNAGPGDYAYSQIGIAPPPQIPAYTPSLPVYQQGSVIVQNILGDVNVLAGSGEQAYALIGLGGSSRDFSDSYSFANVMIYTQNGDVNIVGGSANRNAFAGVGYGSSYTVNGPSVHSFDASFLNIFATNGNITLQAGSSGDPIPANTGNNHAFIGGYLGSINGLTSNINIDIIRTLSGGSTNILGSTGISGQTSQALIGMLGNHSTGISNIEINAGNGFNIDAQNTPANSAPTRAGVQNCLGGSGYIFITVQNGDASILGNSGVSGGVANVVSLGTLDFNVLNGNLFMTGIEDNAYIRTADTTNIYALNDIRMTGNPAVVNPPPLLADATIACAGPLNVTAGDSIHLINNAFIINANGMMEVIAGNDLNLINPLNSVAPPSITNNTGDDMNIVVDNDFPTYPGIGTGALTMVTGSLISNVGGQGLLRIFTARQPLNTIQGLVNGVPFTPGPLYADISPEKWETYYFDSFFHSGAPFTIFYKDGPLFIDTIQRSQLVVSEMLTDFHPLDEYLGWFMEFQTAYDVESYKKGTSRGTSSYQAVPDGYYYLRIPKQFDHNPKINHLITFPKKLETDLPPEQL